jgi:hypothetical protein
LRVFDGGEAPVLRVAEGGTRLDCHSVGVSV